MTDFDVIREALQPVYADTVIDFTDALAALSRVETKLAVSEKSRAEYIEETIRLRAVLFAAEAERDEALRAAVPLSQAEQIVVEAMRQGVEYIHRHDFDLALARVTELEAASKRIRHIAENIADPYNRDERRIAWAEEIIALAAPTKEGTNE